MDISGVFVWAQGYLVQNQFASGGLLVGATGIVVAYFRNVPGKLYSLLRRCVTVEVEVTNRTELFSALEFFLARNQSFTRTRVFRGRYRHSPPSVVEDHDSYGPAVLADIHPGAPRQPQAGTIELSPGTGRHVLFYQRRLVLLERVREERQGGSYGSDTPERFSMTFLTRDRSVVERFLKAAVDACHPPGKKTIRVYSARYDSWRLTATSRVRPPESVVLAEGLFEGLRADVQRFYERGDWYFEMGIPYRRGYLLSGPPGNGKTSTILALAGAFDAPVCILDVGSPSMSDERLRDLMGASPAGAFFILEDVDAVFTGRGRTPPPSTTVPLDDCDKDVPEASKAPGVTFSGLLNALDGLATPDGRLVFMTTNHPERLDPALVRPGRIDKRVEFRNATRDQAERLFLRFFPECKALARRFAEVAGDGTHSMASLQNRLFENQNSAARALLSLVELPEDEEESGDGNEDTREA